MKRSFIVMLTVCLALILVASLASAQQRAQGTNSSGEPVLTGNAPQNADINPKYNTVKQKLMKGQPVFCNTLTSPDTAAARKACEGVDFIWIEMQHSPLTYWQASELVRVIASAGCIPFIRVPDATESDIQKACDIGALGIIVPVVDTVEKAKDAVKFSHFPPIGRRSTGSMNAPGIWGRDYRDVANNEMMVVVFCETVESAMNIHEIAAVPGVDVVFVGASDLGYFSNSTQGSQIFENLTALAVKGITDAGKVVAGPSNWYGRADRKEFMFFQGRRPSGN